MQRNFMQSLGLVLAGFLVGIIVTNINRVFPSAGPGESKQSGRVAEYSGDYQLLAQTAVWDVFAQTTTKGRSIVLGQKGLARVVVTDDQSALYVMTYKAGDPVWQGRLMDVGNDGTVEVADISFGRCEAFK
ncbi:MAG: hypothetical protein AB8G18_15625 [Gammaproteobacteria bacterium]